MATIAEIQLPLSVFSLNGLSGALTLAAGTNVTITPSGNALTIAAAGGGGGGTVTSVGLADSTGLFTISGSPVTLSGTLTLASLNSQTANRFFAAPNGSNGAPTFRTIVAADVPTLNQNTTGTAANITATSNSTLTTLSALSLPTSQLSGNISLASQVSGVLPVVNGGSPPVTRDLWVDKNRTDSFTADGSFTRPFATITAAINQIITNADNSTHAYTIFVAPGAYSETLTFNSAALYNVIITCWFSTVETPQNCSVTGITSTANNTQLATLGFNNITVNGNVNLTGDTNGTNFGSVQVLFSSCQFNNSAGTITMNNVNNVNMYDCQVQGSGSVATFTNLAFGYMNGPEGFISGTTLHLIDNPGGNVPSQYSGNYLLLSNTKNYATTTIDAGSELDSLVSYWGSGSSLTNNGTIHSWNTQWNGSLTLNNGSTTRLQGDNLLNNPTINAGATLTNRGVFYGSQAILGTSAVAAANTIIVAKDGHVKSTQTTAPTTTTNANAGTGASSSVSNATDTAGSLTLTLGSIGTPASGVQMTVNFNKAYNVAPIVIITPSNAVAAANVAAFGVYVTSTVNGFSINFATAGVATDVLTFTYHVLETQ